MKVVCAWCGATIKDGPTDKGISHGICEECYKEQIEKINKPKN